MGLYFVFMCLRECFLRVNSFLLLDDWLLFNFLWTFIDLFVFCFGFELSGWIWAKCIYFDWAKMVRRRFDRPELLLHNSNRLYYYIGLLTAIDKQLSCLLNRVRPNIRYRQLLSLSMEGLDRVSFALQLFLKNMQFLIKCKPLLYFLLSGDIAVCESHIRAIERSSYRNYSDKFWNYRLHANSCKTLLQQYLLISWTWLGRPYLYLICLVNNWYFLVGC